MGDTILDIVKLSMGGIYACALLQTGIQAMSIQFGVLMSLGICLYVLGKCATPQEREA